ALGLCPLTARAKTGGTARSPGRATGFGPWCAGFSAINPSMRLLHTSDWHLGHVLYDQPRTYEHACFLEWLTALLATEQIDALLVSGDIFDTANPPAEAQAAWY